jgi:hypothetical protein
MLNFGAGDKEKGCPGGQPFSFTNSLQNDIQINPFQNCHDQEILS